jgi:hypothetical protein
MRRRRVAHYSACARTTRLILEELGMSNERLKNLAHDLLSTAGTSMAPAAGAICAAIASRGLDGTLLVTANGVPADISGRLPLHVSGSVTFEELSGQPQRALTARLLIGVFDATRFITLEDVEVVEQLFFTRPRGTYGFVFVEVSHLKDTEDVERVLRAGWRLLVPEPKPRWLHQNLAEHDVFLFDDRAFPDEPDLPLDDARQGLERLAKAGDAAGDALARAALLYAIDTTLRSAEEVDAQTSSGDALRRARQRDLARDEVASVRMRLIRRVDSEGAALQRVMETAVIRLRQDLGLGLDGALRGGDGGALQTRGGLGHSFQSFLSATVDRWLVSAQGEIEHRVEDLERELTMIVRGADWSVVNGTIGDGEGYPETLTEALRHAIAPVRRIQVAPSQPLPNRSTLGLPHAGLVVLGTGVVCAITALAGAIPAIVTSVLLGAGSWAIYREQGLRDYARHGQGVIHGVTEQIRLQIEETIDSFIQDLHATLKSALQLASDQITAAAANASPRPSDMTPLRSLRGEIAALDLTAFEKP